MTETDPRADIPPVNWSELGVGELPTGTVTLLLADVTGKDSLVPGTGAPERATFLRWLVFLVANVYPTFTYADIPGRFVEVEAAQQPFVATVEVYRDRLWRQIEGEAGQPWFLGDRFSALDLYVDVMTRWGRKRPWFETNTPKLFAIAERTDRVPELKEMWARNQ